MKGWIVAVCVIACASIMPPEGKAQFVKLETISLPGPTDSQSHGIAFDGTNWHIAGLVSDQFRSYSVGFDSFLGTTAVTGVDEMRGLTYDANSGNLFVGDINTGIVREVTLNGDVLHSFTGGSSMNALAYDIETDTIWLAYFTGCIENRSRDGNLLSSFDSSLRWTGLAYDIANNTLLALDTSDTLYEYHTDGTSLGQIILTDLIEGNGQGLAYDARTATLYATSQEAMVTKFHDPSRAVVPAPGAIVTTLLGVLPGASLLLRKRRRSADSNQ